MQNTKLVSVGNFDFRLHHLLVIGVLILSFSISFLIRSQPAQYGFELNEFDPFFNYRATEYIVNNGVGAYYEWHDDMSWYPHGRDVSATSQVILHLTAASTYWIFGGGSDLYDFTIVFPVVFSSLSAVVIFAFVRVIGGTTAGMFAAMLYSISLPILVRSPMGWFKSEPLGLFFGLLTAYLLLSGINSQNRKVAIAKLVSAGIFTACSISAWGGNQFFIITIGLFFLALPFLRSDHKFIMWAIPLYTASVLVASSAFERGLAVFSLSGISLIGCTAFLVCCIIVQSKSPKNKLRNGLLLLLAVLIVAPSILVIGSESELIPLPSFRYLNAINPFLTTEDPLTDSVAEHATTTIGQSYLFHSVLMIFAGLGIWLILKNVQNKGSGFVKNDMLAFALILGMVGVYISSAFVRLEVFASVAIILLASLGLTALTREFFRRESAYERPIGNLIKIPYAAGIVVILVSILYLPVGADVFALTDVPPTILNGGTGYHVVTNDWLHALEWIKNNTAEDAVVASWWDYGYWIETMGERAALADNSTIRSDIIQNIARMLLSAPDQAWLALQDMQADYVLIFISGERINLATEEPFYTLGGGGDESKKQWFMRIADYEETVFVHPDGASGTDYYWNETLLGQMHPFELRGYVNPNNIGQQSATYVPGTVGIYSKANNYPADGDGPLKLVYTSPSYVQERAGPMIGVFIYEVNKDYEPVP